VRSDSAARRRAAAATPSAAAATRAPVARDVCRRYCLSLTSTNAVSFCYSTTTCSLAMTCWAAAVVATANQLAVVVVVVDVDDVDFAVVLGAAIVADYHLPRRRTLVVVARHRDPMTLYNMIVCVCESDTAIKNKNTETNQNSLLRL
jgi:hypothetical protein